MSANSSSSPRPHVARADVLFVVHGRSRVAAALGHAYPRVWRRRLDALIDIGLGDARVQVTHLVPQPTADRIVVHDREPRPTDVDIDAVWEAINGCGCRVVVGVGSNVKAAISRSATFQYQDNGDQAGPKRFLEEIEVRGPYSWLTAKDADDTACMEFRCTLSRIRRSAGLPDHTNLERKALAAFKRAFAPPAPKRNTRKPPRQRDMGDDEQARFNVDFRLRETGIAERDARDFSQLFHWGTHGYRCRKLTNLKWSTQHATRRLTKWTAGQLTAHLNDELWLSTWLPIGSHTEVLTDHVGLDVDVHSDEQEYAFDEVLAELRSLFPKTYWVRSSVSGGGHGHAFTSKLYPATMLKSLVSRRLLREGLLYRRVDGRLVQVVEVKVDGLRLPFGLGSHSLHLSPTSTKAEMIRDFLRRFRPWRERRDGRGEMPRGPWRVGRRALCGEANERWFRREAQRRGVSFGELDFEEIFAAEEHEYLAAREPRRALPLAPRHKRALRTSAERIFPARDLLQRPIAAYHTRYRTTRRIIRSLAKHGWRDDSIRELTEAWLRNRGHLSHDLEDDRQGVFDELPGLVAEHAAAARKSTAWHHGGGVRYLPSQAPEVITQPEHDWIADRIDDPDAVKAALLIAERFRLLGTDEAPFSRDWMRELLGRRYGNLLDEVRGVCISLVRDADVGQARVYRLLLPSLPGKPITVADVPWATPIGERPRPVSQHNSPEYVDELNASVMWDTRDAAGSESEARSTARI